MPMKKLIFFYLFFSCFTSHSQKWEDCCWTKLKSGLEIKIIEKGLGKKIKDGEHVKINCIWYDFKTGDILSNGMTEFPQGVEWVVGSLVYAIGYEEGLKKLKRGGSAFIKIPPELAFGDKGYLGQTTLCYYIKIIK